MYLEDVKRGLWGVVGSVASSVRWSVDVRKQVGPAFCGCVGVEGVTW